MRGSEAVALSAKIGPFDLAEQADNVTPEIQNADLNDD